MPAFTIDPDNNITALVEGFAGGRPDHAFSSEKELAARVADWPMSRLVDAWNSFAGVTPFDDLKPVRKFTSRQTAVARIWAAVGRLSSDRAQPARDVAPERSGSKKGVSKSKRRDTARKGAAQAASNKKAEVVALMQRAKGATLAEITDATGWQKHTVRGFVSILGSKGGHQVESAKNTAGERTYRIAK